VEEAIDGHIELVLPDFVLEELTRLVEKLGFGAEHVEAARQLLERVAAIRAGAPTNAEAITGDPDDDIVLACAVDSQADVLVSGDRKHLLPVGERHGVRMLTPQALLAELRAHGR
jgi:uncharacterized protein